MSMRVVGSPLTAKHLKPLEPDCEWVQFGAPLTKADHAQLADLLATRPDVWLRIYFDGARNLRFLRSYPELRRFKNHVYELSDLAGIEQCVELTHLDVDEKRSRPDLAPIAGLPALRVVKLEKCKGTNVLRDVPALRDVTLVGCNLGTAPGTWQGVTDALFVQHKGALPDLPAAKHLGISATTIADLDQLRECPSLEVLELHSIRGLRALPDLSNLPKLRRVVLYRTRDLVDLSGLRAASALREVSITEVDLKCADVAFLDELPDLETCELELSQSAENTAAIRAIRAASAG